MPRVINEAVDNSNPAVSVGVQSWSRGPIFPAVIAVVEKYDTPYGFKQWGDVSTLGHHNHAKELYQAYLTNFFARPLADRLIDTSWVLHYPGHEPRLFHTYERAVAIAGKRNSQRDTDGRPLVFGNLYAERYTNENGEGNHGFGRIVWFAADGNFYDADSGEEVRIDGDALVHQAGCFSPIYAEVFA